VIAYSGERDASSARICASRTVIHGSAIESSANAIQSTGRIARSPRWSPRGR
jgi:hypothetical protein